MPSALAMAVAPKPCAFISGATGNFPSCGPDRFRLGYRRFDLVHVLDCLGSLRGYGLNQRLAFGGRHACGFCDRGEDAGYSPDHNILIGVFPLSVS
jgi:hypothetical protein